MRIVSHIFLLMTLAQAVPMAVAQDILYNHLVTSGYRHLANTAKVPSSRNPENHRKLLFDEHLLSVEATSALDRHFSSTNTKTMLVLKGGKLAYEKYAAWGGLKHTPLGYSMSKSLTALAVGKAYCAGHIGSLDDRLAKYVPELQGSSWGNATVAHLLKMSSGAYSTSIVFDGHKDQKTKNRMGSELHEGKFNQNFISYMKDLDEKSQEPGQFFDYNNMDTIALGILVSVVAKQHFAEYFSDVIWKPVGAESDGAWMQNNRNQVASYNGFSATPRDWARVGLYVVDQIKRGDDCFSRYLQQAVAPQIESNSITRTYGYQIWTQCAPKVDFCFIGYGGQYLLFNLKEEAIIFHHAATTRNTQSTMWLMQHVVD